MDILDFPFTFLSLSESDTEECGAALCRYLLSSDGELPAFVALYGDLGAGKTAFTRGLASVAAPGARVKSPTFALMREYRGTLATVHHFDMYRITGDGDLYSTGFYDIDDGITVTEWSENIPYALPPRYYRVTVSRTQDGSGNSRLIEIVLTEESGKEKTV